MYTYKVVLVMYILLLVYGCSAMIPEARKSADVHIPILSTTLKLRTLDVGVYVVDVSEDNIKDFGYIGIYVSYTNIIDYYAYKLEQERWDRIPYSTNKYSERPPFKNKGNKYEK